MKIRLYDRQFVKQEISDLEKTNVVECLVQSVLQMIQNRSQQPFSILVECCHPSLRYAA